MRTMKAMCCLFAAMALVTGLQTEVKATETTDENQFQVYLPEPLTPELSVDENMIINGVGLRAVIVDPNPDASPRQIPPPVNLTTAPQTATASFTIDYVAAGGADLWGEACYAFPADAQVAFTAAADIWANIISSSVPITIRACWGDLGSSSTLGYSGGGTLHYNFPGAPLTNTVYSASLANALSGTDLNVDNHDMHITYNRNFTWYTGTDGNTPIEEYDLLSVVLHEMAHGLNFSGSMSYSGGLGSWGYGANLPNIYDIFVKDGARRTLLNTFIYPNPSIALGTALTSNNIWFNGTNAVAANGGTLVKMYAPSTWNGGSSYSHLDYATFNDTANELMVYAFSSGESVHDPGVVTNGLLKDLGWTSDNTSSVTLVPILSLLLSKCDVIGDWDMTYDWDCDGESGTVVNYYNTDHTFSVSDDSTGTWSLSGKQLTWVYDSTVNTTYVGTLNSSCTSMSGTMSNSLPRTGCFTANRTDSAPAMADNIIPENVSGDSKTETLDSSGK